MGEYGRRISIILNRGVYENLLRVNIETLNREYVLVLINIVFKPIIKLFQSFFHMSTRVIIQ